MKSPDSKKASNAAIDWFFQLTDYVRNLTRPGEQDPTWILILKVIGQGFLILLMILLSPVLLIGLFIAFVAVF